MLEMGEYRPWKNPFHRICLSQLHSPSLTVLHSEVIIHVSSAVIGIVEVVYFSSLTRTFKGECCCFECFISGIIVQIRRVLSLATGHFSDVR